MQIKESLGRGLCCKRVEEIGAILTSVRLVFFRRFLYLQGVTIYVKVYLRAYFSESNAIEDGHSESALKKTLEAWEFLKGAKELTHRNLQTAHEKILEDRQPEIAGEYRDVKVTVGERVPPPPIVVDSEMDKLLAWTPSDPLETIEWHVAFERIHPFADGNGRIGRLVYCWQCRDLGAEPLVWRAEDWEGYYDLFEREVDLDAKSPLID